eukprot:scaffold5349_cov131-Skeletonema_marinoi.AAC.1
MVHHRGAKRLKLWSGLQTPLPSTQSAGGIMNGYLPHRSRRGGCKICCPVPSLWPFVAQALGFT